MREDLVKFIQSELQRGGSPQQATADDDLLAPGMMDSLGIIRLLAFIEEEWNIRVPPEDVIAQNFRTINALEHYLMRARV
jgi:acyl carrier protein